MEGLVEHNYATHAFLVASRVLECSCICTNCRQPSNHFKEMSNEFHMSAEEVLKACNLWGFLPYPARGYASFLPAAYTALPQTQDTISKSSDVEDCLGRNVLIRFVDYLDEETACSRVRQFVDSNNATACDEANDRTRAAINHQDILGRSILHPLHFAAAVNFISICEILVHDYMQPVNLTHKFGFTPANYANGKRFNKVAQFLYLSALASTNKLHTAVEKGDLAEAQYALNLGADPNSKYGNTHSALEKVICRHDLLLLQTLGDCPRTLFDLRSDDSLTPLLKAVDQGFTKGVEYLVQCKSMNINAMSAEGHTPLWLSILRGNTAIARILLGRHDVDVNGYDAAARLTPLMKAALIPQPEIIDLLLSRKDMNVNALDHDGRTALHVAAGLGYAEVLERFLKRADVDIHVRTRQGQTAVEIARVRNHLDVVRMLEVWTTQKEDERRLELVLSL
ncbi:ankyrin [Karstenula rhodostoma CBS 690.94]|uniref:Ankyrin n=1 Tax=Karstenula rhodostoma CBS 690.94 TaxID=1392251 RepID=A0A9P4PP97_9PLEO|nr:ankyrin [Karstenula rhodostoma CBS 690.94]